MSGKKKQDVTLKSVAEKRNYPKISDSSDQRIP